MLPLLAPNQTIDRGDGNAISFPYFSESRSIWLLPDKQYLAGLRLSNLTVWAISATLTIISALGYAIENIVQIISEPKVRRVAARRVVAMVKHVNPIWNSALIKSPSQSVGFSHFFTVPRQTISAAVFGQTPWPARVWAAGLVHFGPKLIYGGWLDGCIAVMAEAPIMLVAQAKRLMLSGAAIDSACSHGEVFTLYGGRAQQ